ncbi:MAG: hypothetical protein D6788_06785 [Planctomycetota bacterium]|nr:MAG: hypothetical protein D6788_06785 [Planctomycetota bacterium]
MPEVPSVIFLQIPVETSDVEAGATDDSSSRKGPFPGARIVQWGPGAADKVATLTEGFAAVGRFDLSFDGRKILFAGRRRDESYSAILEMDIDRRTARRVTREPRRYREAVYLSPIYRFDEDRPHRLIAFTADAEPFGVPVLFTCRLDGSDVRPITHTPSAVRSPYLLSDGRIVFSLMAGGPGGASPSAVEALYTVFADGADVFPFAAPHAPPARRSMTTELPDGTVVYVESRDPDPLDGGRLVTVRRVRSLSTRRVVPGTTEGFYHSPSGFDDRTILVSYRASGAESYGIHLLDLESGRRTLLFDDPRYDDLFARVRRPRTPPAGRSTNVRSDDQPAYLYCLDVRITRDGADAAHPPSRARRVRILTAVPTLAVSKKNTAEQQERTGFASAPDPNDHGARGVALAEAPIYEDGSFYLQVPAAVPLRVETIGENGEVLQRMRSWFWVMPGESRGCIGCHEDRERTPPDRHVLALRNPPFVVPPLSSVVRRPAK